MIIIQYREIEPTGEVIHFLGSDPMLKTTAKLKTITWSQDDSQESLEAAKKHVQDEEFYNDKRDYLKVLRIR